MFKFFNKNFFKFSLGFLAIIFASLLFMVAVSAYASSVSKISFTSEERTVALNEISEGLTIQTQDSSGSSIQTPETLDLEFFSTSNTGEFLSSTGNPTTKTMNKNTSNRTFYYRDSVSGVFTITVKATGRDSGEVFEASQKIAVGDSTLGTSGEVLSLSTSQGSSLSATAGASAPSTSDIDTKLEISIGKDRLTSVGSPITLQAQIKKNVSSNSSVSFAWSFGDGNVGEGPLVTHTYKYPGEYALVLNANSGSVFASTRIKVLVIDPEITLLDKGEYIEILNNSKYEINLFNWKIVCDAKGFIFQPDTIVFPKSKIVLDKKLLSLKGEQDAGLILKNSLGQRVASSNSITEEEKMRGDLAKAKMEVSRIVDAAIAGGVVKEIYPTNYQKTTSMVATGVEVSPGQVNTAHTDEILEIEDKILADEILYEAEQVGVVTRLTNFIKRLFYK